MRIDRGYLFWGIVFVLLGAIPLADREGWVHVVGVTDALRLWPLLVIGVGVAILFSRTRLALLATVVGALVLGTIAGTALASLGGGTLFECARTGDPTLERTNAQGAFELAPVVSVSIDCGDLSVTTAAGLAWTLDAGHAGGPPRVEATATGLSMRPADGPPRRQDWTLALPAQLDTMRLQASASGSTLDLSGATLIHLHAEVNAGELRLDAPTGRMDTLELQANAADVHILAPSVDIQDLSVEANAASVTLSLGGSATGSVEGAAMSARVCVPPDASLDITTRDDMGFSHDLRATGLVQTGDGWQRAGTGPRITLVLGGTASSVTLVDDGSCA